MKCDVECKANQSKSCKNKTSNAHISTYTYKFIIIPLRRPPPNTPPHNLPTTTSTNEYIKNKNQQ